MSNAVIEIRGLRKAFDGRPAVDGLDLDVQAGSIFGFLGRNGAGKTTTIRLLLGCLKSGGGEIRLFGEAVRGPGSAVDLRRRIGFVSESKHLYPYMTVEQMIRFTRPFFPAWRRCRMMRNSWFWTNPRRDSTLRSRKSSCGSWSG